MPKTWKDWPDTSTPVTASELNRLEAALATAIQPSALADAVRDANQQTKDGLTAASNALTAVKTDLLNRQATTNYDVAKMHPKQTSFQRTTQSSKVSLTGGTSAVAATLITNPSKDSWALWEASIQIVPGGNAGGVLHLKINGATVAQRFWHTQNSSSHQWPSIRWGQKVLVGTQYKVELVLEVTPGSSATDGQNAELTAEFRPAP